VTVVRREQASLPKAKLDSLYLAQHKGWDLIHATTLSVAALACAWIAVSLGGTCTAPRPTWPPGETIPLIFASVSRDTATASSISFRQGSLIR
jgi:hypothetical protein